jgi:hypothetical protein
VRPSQRASGFSVWRYAWKSDTVATALAQDYGWSLVTRDHAGKEVDPNFLTIDGADLAARRAAKAEPTVYFQVRRGRSPDSQTQSYRETSPLWLYSARKKFDATARGLPEAA